MSTDLGELEVGRFVFSRQACALGINEAKGALEASC